MLAAERRAAILRTLQAGGSVRVADLAFELLAGGPVALRLTDDGVDVLVSSAEGTPTEPARILVDGSMVETFHKGASHTTRAYPSASSSWVVDGAGVTAYRLGDRDGLAAGADGRPSHRWQPGS